ncbi:MAG: hypothetical protein KGJ06_04730, partial [Pseudomonadota bacterium]|nr:hypothetical protein [Pseudomonadota bacterium]
YDRFANRKITFPDKSFIPSSLRKQNYRDFLGGIGGAMFVAGFAIRFFAPYGTKELDMREAYAHATDTLAKTPPEKLPQLLADTAVTLKESLKDKENITFGEIYTHMKSDLYRYHRIGLDSNNDIAAAPPTEIAAAPDGQAVKGSDGASLEIPYQPASESLAAAERKPQDRAAAPEPSHVAQVAKSKEACAPCMLRS